MKQLSTLGRRRRLARRQFIWNMARLLIVAALLVLFAVAAWLLPADRVLWSLLGALILNAVIAFNHRRDWYVVT